jgi:hypothetical protein
LRRLDDPLKYINEKSLMKLDKMHAENIPHRLYAAREKVGRHRYKDIFGNIFFDANDRMLSDMGVKKGYTKEKMDGTYRRPAEATEENFKILLPDYLVEVIKHYFDQSPNMFEQDDKLKSNILDELKGNRIKLRKYPELVAAMFKGEEIPEDL